MNKIMSFMFRRRCFSSPKTERRYFFSTNQGSCDIYADGVYVGRYLGTGITEFTYSTSRDYINISLVGISLPDQVYYAYMLDNELRTGVGDFTIV